jgi:beta-fructofuranosidase
VSTDPTFPRLHGRPPAGWINDPNGCSYLDGRYHVFFQYNPDSTAHLAIRWGHMSSTDLVRWRAEPVALMNRPGELDAYGCWSGCVVDDNGVPTAVYSAVADASHRSAVVLARGDRNMTTWSQDRKPVATTPDDPHITHVRDPFVFEAFGRRYAILGAGHTERGGRILVYGCDDLTSWTPLGALLTSDNPVAAEIAPANIWECPNIVRIGDRWVMILSLWRRPDPDEPCHLAGVRYLVGDLTLGQDGPLFDPASGGRLDDGPCFYAPQVLSHDGRTLMWGWAWERGRTPEEIARAGWAGVLTFCRELSLSGNVLSSRPVPELDGLRREPLPVRSGEPFAATAFDCVLPPHSQRVSLWRVDGAREHLVAERCIPPSQLTSPRIMVDGSLVEIFDGGPTAYTTRAYPTVDSRWLIRLATPGPIRAWRL